MAHILAAFFEMHFIVRCPIVSERSSQSTTLWGIIYVSCRSVTPVTITPPPMTPASRNFIVIPINRRPFSLPLLGLASGHFISHPLRPRSREGGQWNSSLRISERHPTSPTPPSSPSSPPFLLQHPLPRSSRRFLAFTLSLSLPLSFAEIGIYERGRERGRTAR